MKTYYGNYLGMVIDNNDPEFRGRVQVFVPHIMPALYEGWNKEGNNLTIKCVGDNVPQGLTQEITDRLKKILPWAEAASPIIGQSSPGNVVPAAAMAAINDTSAGGAAGAGAGGAAGAEGAAAGGQNLNQTPTAMPAGTLSPGTTLLMPKAHSGVIYQGLAAQFVQRLNAFYKEATSLGYKITCTSGWRSYATQADLYRKNPRGAAPPGGTTHEMGVAVDLIVTGLGVKITEIDVNASKYGRNYDTPAFRALLTKYNLHQPLHPSYGGTQTEHWHIEPIETPRAMSGGSRFPPMAKNMFARLNTPAPTGNETTSSSQFPAASNPLTSSSPSTTEKGSSITPKTGMVPQSPPATSSAPTNTTTSAASAATAATAAAPTSSASLTSPGGTLTSSTPAAQTAASSSGTAVASGPTTGATPAPATTGAQNQLAKDRTEYFKGEIGNPHLLDRLEYVMFREGGSSAHLILETACNRAMFGNTSLTKTVFGRGYYHTKVDPQGTATKPHTKKTLDIIQRVIYNGANETDLATDQGYNDEHLFINKFIKAGVKGNWFDLTTGKKITDPAKINRLVTSPGTGQEEFIYQKCGYKDGFSLAGSRAAAYGKKYNIQPTSPSTFQPNVPLPPDLVKSRSSELNPGKEVGALPAIDAVNNTDPHGPTVIKNTNDMAKGMFTYPGVGAMVWIFFREGNPLFPVYFAASYSSDEWKSAYNGASLNPQGTNNGSVGTQIASSTHVNPNAGGGLEFTHIKDVSDPSGASDKAVAMMYGDDGSNMMFSRGYHQIYTRHDRRDQIDGRHFNIVGGAEERWVQDDSNTNIRGNVFIKVGKFDSESMEAMKELTDFSNHLNQTLLSNSGK